MAHKGAETRRRILNILIKTVVSIGMLCLLIYLFIYLFDPVHILTHCFSNTHSSNTVPSISKLVSPNQGFAEHG